MKKQFRIGSIFILALLLLIIPAFTLAGSSEQADIENISVTLTNDGKVIGVNDLIDPAKDTVIRVDFTIPMDDEGSTVQAGQWVDLPLPQGLHFVADMEIPVYLQVEGSAEQKELATFAVNADGIARLTFGEEVENPDYLAIGGY
ncbi:MAG: hypothetical protein RR051_03980, partial [Clostridiales bacterium]